MNQNQINRNRAEFEKELLSTGRTGIGELLETLKSIGFYNAPCVGHDKETGGTLNHSLWTLFVAREALKKNPVDYPGVTDEGLVIVSLLHDICDSQGGLHQIHGHGRRSAKILSQLGVGLSDEEMSAIRFHRGHRIIDDFDKNLDRYFGSPLMKILKHADHTAAGVMNGVVFGESPIRNALSSGPFGDAKIIFNPLVVG